MFSINNMIFIIKVNNILCINSREGYTRLHFIRDFIYLNMENGQF